MVTIVATHGWPLHVTRHVSAWRWHGGGARVGEGHGDRDDGAGGVDQHQEGADHLGQISG